MGNTPTNTPYEGAFIERLVSWWAESGAGERFSLLFRPHPRDREWRVRFAAALGRPGAAVQEPSFTDIDLLATILQHTEAVVVNAGTVLLVVDASSSLWPVTVASAALRRAGARAVLPLLLHRRP